jgi:hypothetical protein
MTKAPFENAYFKNLRSILKAQDLMARGTNRTNNIVKDMKDGDILVVHSASFAAQLNSLIPPERGLLILSAGSTRDLHSLMAMMPRKAKGIIHIDHHLMDIMRDEALNNLETTVNIFRFRNEPFAG